MHSNSTAPEKPAPRHSLLGNLAFNIIIPTLILTKMSGDDWLGIQWALIVALAFPLIYGGRDLVQSGKVNFFSVLGIIGILLNGGVGLLELDRRIIIIKEAAIPALIGLAVLISQKTRFPLVRKLLLNDQLIHTERVNDALKEHNGEAEFERRLAVGTYLIVGAMMLSAVLNYILAATIITADTGTVAFNEQLGKMQALSFPVIALPVTVVMMSALFYLFRAITRLTGLQLEEIVRAGGDDDSSKPSKEA